MSRRLATSVSRALGIVLAGVAVTGVAACSPSAPSGTPNGADGPLKLSVWGWRTEDVKAYNEIFDLYEKRHRGVEVEYKAFKNTEYNTILQTGLAGSAGPDLAQLRAYGELQPLIAAGALSPLDEQATGLTQWPRTTIDGARGAEDGKVYGVPFAIQTMHVIYNKKLFADHGLEPPRTWAGFLELARDLKSKDVTPMAVTVKDDWMLPIEHEIFGASSYGGNAFRDKLLAGTAKFTDAPFVKSLEVYRSLTPYWQKNFLGVGYDDAKALFASGRAAMFPGGVWEVAAFRAQAPGLELGIFNVPPPPGAAVDRTLTPGFVDGSFGVSARTPRREAARELLAWMATPEFGQAFSDRLVQISPVPGVVPKDPVLKQAVDSYSANPSPYLMYADFSFGSPMGADLLKPAITNLLAGKSSAHDAAAALQRGVEQWFRPRK